jgi:2,3-dihydroxybenzoate-AMP ligase
MTRSDKVVAYPADVVERYRREGLWGTRTISGELRAVAERYPDVEALVTAERRVTYAELDARSDAIAARLVHVGLRPGDPVVLQLGNTAEAVEAFYGLIKMGAVPICALVPFGHHEIDAIATIAAARAHLVQTDLPGRDLLAFAHDVRTVVPSLRFTLTVRGGDESGIRIDDVATPAVPPGETRTADDVAVLQLSGGTSGTPKLIPHLHSSYWYYGRATAQRWGYAPGTRIGHFMPVFHNSGLHAGVFAAHSVGATLVLGSVWSPAEVLATLKAERITHLATLTSLVTEICDDPAYPAATRWLRRLSLAIPQVPGELFDRLDTGHAPVCQFFGMSEGFSTSMPTDAPRQMRRETIGFPLSQADELRLINPDTGEPADGTVGELCVRGPYTVRGYYDAAEYNATAFTPDGFLRTGDLASVIQIDGTACLRLEGRVKDLVSRGGEKINANEIETLLRRHPGVEDAALIGMPDPRLGQRPCVFVVASPAGAPTLEDIRGFLDAAGVARFKWPQRLEIVDAFPRTPVGKVAKRMLVEQPTTKDTQPVGEVR